MKTITYMTCTCISHYPKIMVIDLCSTVTVMCLHAGLDKI